MKKGKYKPEHLWGEIVSEHHIDCSKCKATDNVSMCDDYGACEHFFMEGWRKTLNYCYCPKCSKKYLKQ